MVDFTDHTMATMNEARLSNRSRACFDKVSYCLHLTLQLSLIDR